MSIRANRPPVPTLADLIARLGSHLITIVRTTPEGQSRAVLGIQLYDPAAPDELAEGHVVVAPSRDTSLDEVARLVQRAVEADVVSILCGADAPIDAGVEQACGDRLTLLRATAGVDWSHLITILRLGLTGGTARPSPRATRLGDLFGFANEIAERLGGAVTLEDQSSVLLAYSNIHGPIDEPRKETILGRAVPGRYLELMSQRGVLSRLADSDEVMEIDAIPEVGLQRRLAVRVAVAGSTLGSIWLAETDTPLNADAVRGLEEAAGTAALHLMAHITDLERGARLQVELVRQLLSGGNLPPDVIALRLGLDPNATFTVVAVEAIGQATPAERLLNIAELYSNAYLDQAPIYVEGPRVYIVVAAVEARVESTARRVATDIVDRARTIHGLQVRAGIGDARPGAIGILDARADADRVLRVLLHEDELASIATFAEVYAHSALQEIRDALQGRPHLERSPLRRLDGHPQGGLWRETLREYLAAFGRVSEAAAKMHCHPNTLRYRLERAREVLDVDLDDPVGRLVVTLLLEVEHPQVSSGSSTSPSAAPAPRHPGWSGS